MDATPAPATRSPAGCGRHLLIRLAIATGFNLTRSSSAPRLTVIRAAVGNQVRLIQVGDVVYFEATDKYVNVATADSASLIRMSLRELLDRLDPAQFWQIHRGTVVHRDHVSAAVRDDSGRLRLSLRARTETLPVSRVFGHLFRQM